ncbi:MAG TPA: DnaA regulatory inactivator Hda [Steroidobacteraceae bacterium]|jgi:DnaA family protein|nr:DnaA regulatory inactivator Hda [Steroidobacteraceae bacterium]
MRQLPLGVRLQDRAVFASFFAGPNLQAAEHVSALASSASGGVAWLAGPAGAGKTHLLQAACAAASTSRRAGYLPLAELAPLGSAVLDGLREIECLSLDDVHAVAGDMDWERALFGLFCALEERGGRLIAAASAPPALLAWALPDLASRFAASAVFQLRTLDEAEQREALKLRAQLRGLDLPEETARYLQRRFPRDMRTLYHLLDTLDEAAIVAQRRLTVPFIRSVLQE